MDEETAKTIIQIIEESKPETTQELVNLAKAKLALSEQQVLEHILRLQEEGKITLRKRPKPAPTSLIAYLKTEDARWYWTTMAVACATVLTVFLVPEDSFPLVYVRYVLGATFVLWLPGYSFIKALFPKERKPEPETTANLDTVERVALSIGLSLALVPLVGLLLNYTPWGIRLTPIVLSLLFLTAILATIAVAREHQDRLRKTA